MRNVFHKMIEGSVVAFLCVMTLLFFSACTPSCKQEVDELNRLSYAYHYRNLDSTKIFAKKALSLADGYSEGYAEACNNLAFVAIARMDYATAEKWLEQVRGKSDNQIELLIADVQNMRICQRQAHNKDFYSYREKALARLRRISEETDRLPQRERLRVCYARSEFAIVAATYFYYIGLEEPMLEALGEIQVDKVEQDTAQYLNYLYNIGSGGAITQGSSEQVAQTEFDYLVQCYMVASASPAYPYWQANALQAISEHLQKKGIRDFLIKNNQPAIKYLNDEQMPDSLLAGNLAQRALNLFQAYGDVYQIAGGYRTLAECYFAIEDYQSAGNSLLRALDNPRVNAAPDLVASIRERLSMVYSAIDDKPNSDYNRNLYLDLQEQSRQDRKLEARVAMLEENAYQLNWMIAAVLLMIAIVVALLYVFDRMRRRKARENSVEKLLMPLKEWSRHNILYNKEISEKKEEMQELQQVARLHLLDNKKRNLEQRAKVSLVNSIMPFIDRMMHEVSCLADKQETEQVRLERYRYISELTGKINQYNDVLTQWIQMRQGTLSIRTESFALQPLFDIVAKGKMGFLMKGIQLEVLPTELKVKADRTLTLFMINTIADNARKFTASGGKVTIEAQEQADCVEIVIEDTGKGMSKEQLAHIFDRTYTGGHGFGLLNCKGIIEKYKKVSSIFAVCDIRVESELGKGSRFAFRLPKGQSKQLFGRVVKRTLVTLVVMAGIGTWGMNGYAQGVGQRKLHHNHSVKSASLALQKADHFADSAYFSNINGTYAKTLQFADSAIFYLNQHYLLQHPRGKMLMVSQPKYMDAAELHWLRDSLSTAYQVILDIRNESAVAALALHRWQLYDANNKVYTHLFREKSSDSTLPDYVRTMQQTENSKTVAIILLTLLLLQLPIAYYFLYYRHVLSYQYSVEKVNLVNHVLLSDLTDEAKLQEITTISNKYRFGEQLRAVVEQVKHTLTKSLAVSQNETEELELMEDELRRLEYENGKYHIANQVLDNCLSTLKHETMFYPSRIRQLVEKNPTDVAALGEVVDYYKSLYMMLSAQAMEQVETYVRFDKDLLRYLFEIFSKESGDGNFHLVAEPKREHYTCYRGEMVNYRITEEQCRQLFTPLTCNMKFLLCRQIVREVGEVTNMRGCGVMAELTKEGYVAVSIILPNEKAIDRILKDRNRITKDIKK